ncbi:hypothetical protein [Streptomyces sp. NPDC002088]|uniref:hypothetical protein n=1 Tax=Streptomyces sp. NPDC002088 TaxID=3154665 RepID=UPI0033180A3D
MSHPLVRFLLARYDEEDPAHTNSAINELRDEATEMECHLIASDDPDAYGEPKRDVAWAVLRLQALKYRDHPGFNDTWRLVANSRQPPQEPTP